MHMVMTRSFVTRLGMRWLAVVHDSAVLEDDRSFDQNLEDEARSIGARFDTLEAQTRIAAFAAASARRRSDKQESP